MDKQGKKGKSGVGGQFKLQAIFKLMVDSKASDLHLTAGAPPKLRIDGKLVSVSMPSLTMQDTRNLIYQVLTEVQRKVLDEKLELDFSFEIKGIARFRGNVFFSKGAMAAAFRLVPSNIPKFKELGLPDMILEMVKVKNGLILVTGETGSGKSTTLASMLDHINNFRSGHIVTLEDPVEFVHEHKSCIINQREVGTDTFTFQSALRSLLRQDLDIALVGEMRDAETMEAALTIAETGHLVFGTLHTNSCVQTITRLVNSFPAAQQQQVRVMLSFVLQGVVSQQLIPRSDGVGRAIALEMLIPNTAVRNLIREGKIHQIYSQMQIGQGSSGMITMNQSLMQLVMDGAITASDARQRSTDLEELKGML